MNKNIKDGISDVFIKAKGLVNTAKLKQEISLEKKAIKKDFLDIGKYYYEKYQNEEIIDEIPKALAKSIDEHKANIWEIQGEIDDI